MPLLGRVRIATKIFAVIAGIGVVVGGCVWYAQAQMTAIDDAYGRFITGDARAVESAQRLNQQIYKLNYFVYRTLGETYIEPKKAAGAGFEATLPEIKATLAALTAQAPEFVTAIGAQEARVDRFLQEVVEVRRLAGMNMNEDALELIHEKIDPTFDAMVQEGNSLSERIQAAMSRGSEALSRRTDATRHALIGISAAGLLLGLLTAALITVLGITRPIGRLVGILQRMARGESEAPIAEARRGDEIGAVARAVEEIRALVARKAAEQAETARIADEAAAEAGAGRCSTSPTASRRRWAASSGRLVRGGGAAIDRLDHDGDRRRDRRAIDRRRGPPPRRPPRTSAPWRPPPRSSAPRSRRSAGRSRARPRSPRARSPRPTRPRSSCRTSAARWRGSATS